MGEKGKNKQTRFSPSNRPWKLRGFDVSVHITTIVKTEHVLQVCRLNADLFLIAAISSELAAVELWTKHAVKQGC